QPPDLLETRVGGRLLDDSQRPRQRSGHVRDGNACPGGSVVEGKHLHPERAPTISRLASAIASGSFAASLPPARAIVGLPPPPPPTSAAAALTTSEALTRSATVWSKLATRWTRPSSLEPRTTAAGECPCLKRSDRSSSESASRPSSDWAMTFTPRT